MPDTGLLPTIAMAFAATVVNRKAITVTTIHATAACQNVDITPAQKKMNTAMSAIPRQNVTVFMDRSVCQRTVAFPLFLSPLNSLPASPTACRMIGHDFMMPMTPAIAIPPIPIMRA